MSDNLQDPVFDDTTETEGFRAYKAGLKAGAAAERERIRQVLVDYAEAVAADKGGSSDAFNAVADFADLLEPDAP